MGQCRGLLALPLITPPPKGEKTKRCPSAQGYLALGYTEIIIIYAVASPAYGGGGSPSTT